MEIKRRLHKDKWIIRVVTAKQMKKEADGDEDTKGLCDTLDKIIFIRDDSVYYDVIAHEIFHAYFSYLYLDDTNNIGLADFEEIGANFFAAEAEEMVRRAKKITKELQKRMGENE